MNSKTLSHILLAGTLSLSSVSKAEGFWELFGQLTGALLGGALCDELEIGKGDGRTAAVALCALGGALIGSEIGRDMDANDARAFEVEQERSFRGELNRDYSWDGSQYGSRTGVRGRLRPINEGYHQRTREICREYISVTYHRNRKSETRSIVCQRSDGSFYSLEQRNLYVNGRLVESESREQRDRPRYQRCEGWDSGHLERGEFVINRFGQKGMITGVQMNGVDVLVDFGYGFPQRMKVSELALTGCHYGLQTGARVQTRFGEKGFIEGIFYNGRVAVNIRGMIQIFQQRDLYF